MKTLTINWKHLDVEGETCDRCNETGLNLISEVEKLNKELNSRGFRIVLEETKLEGEDIHHSNEVLLDGVAIEEILSIEVSDNYCESCSKLMNEDAYCRTVLYKGRVYEDIPSEAIKHGAYKVLGIQTDKIQNNPFNVLSDCGCKGDGCC
jgi:hypothetical protein